MKKKFAKFGSAISRPYSGFTTLFYHWTSSPVLPKDLAAVTSRLAAALAANLINAILLLAAVGGELPAIELIVWFGLYCTLLLFICLRRFSKGRGSEGNKRKNPRNLLSCTSIMIGLPWAWMATMHIGTVKNSAEIAIFVVCAGMSAGSAIILARVPRVLTIYLLTVLGSVFTKCLVIGSTAYLSIAGFTFVYAYCLSIMAALLATAERRVEDNAGLLTDLLENIPQGVCLYSSSQQVVMRNNLYGQIYGLSLEQLPAGTTLQRVIELRVARGMFAEQSGETYLAERKTNLGISYNKVHKLPDGRYIAVGHRPLGNGGWVTSHEDVTSLKKAEERVAYLAHHDPLTNLANRTLLGVRLDMALNQVERGHSLDLLMLDLDKFKSVNDTYGHLVGDELLKIVSERLTAAVRAGDTVARLGGDEFVVVLVNCAPCDAAHVVSKRIITALTKPFEISRHKITIGVSIGISQAGPVRRDQDNLFKAADRAMYRAKLGGGNRACVAQEYQDMNYMTSNVA